jgi:hypothetical protein
MVEDTAMADARTDADVPTWRVDLPYDLSYLSS